MYQRIIMIPRPDYASRYGNIILPNKVNYIQEHSIVIWRNLVLRNGGRISDMLDLSCLAKVTDGYTPGHMNTAVQQVLTERRIAQVETQSVITLLYYKNNLPQLHKRPLVASELITPLAKIDPIYHEEEEEYKV